MSTEIMTKWNYDKSVLMMRPLVVKWKNCTVEMLEELYIAREELSKEGRPFLTGTNVPVSWAQYCEEIGLEKRTANRWLASYNPETKQIEDKSTAHVSYNSGNNEWYTPAEYADLAREVLGKIDLDPASTPKANEIIKANKIFTENDDSLNETWAGNVWMNPPYSSDKIGEFTRKFVNHYYSGDIKNGIVLVNNATDTEWFQTLAAGALAVCFPAGRIKFWNPDKETASPLQGQAILYFGNNVDLFINKFSPQGLVFHA